MFFVWSESCVWGNRARVGVGRSSADDCERSELEKEQRGDEFRGGRSIKVQRGKFEMRDFTKEFFGRAKLGVQGRRGSLCDDK